MKICNVTHEFDQEFPESVIHLFYWPQFRYYGIIILLLVVV